LARRGPRPHHRPRGRHLPRPAPPGPDGRRHRPRRHDRRRPRLPAVLVPGVDGGPGLRPGRRPHGTDPLVRQDPRRHRPRDALLRRHVRRRHVHHPRPDRIQRQTPLEPPRLPVDRLPILHYGSMAGGVMFTNLAPTGSNANLLSYLFGSLSTVSPSDVTAICVLAPFVILVTLGLRRQLFAVSQDEEFARVTGLPVRFLNL